MMDGQKNIKLVIFMFADTSSKNSTQSMKLLNFTFILPCIVIDFFLITNQTH